MRKERTINYYTVLELSPTATQADIKNAWYEQVQIWHPDRFNHAPALHRKAEARTQLINQAYQVLGDPAARARYDTAETPSSPAQPSRPSPSPRPQPTPRPRQDVRGPQSLVTLIRHGQPNVVVPAIQLLVDTNEQRPYDFRGLVRIAGTIRRTLPAGDYAIAEAPELLCIERRRAEELHTIVSNPSERLLLLRELEGLLAFTHRFFVIEGTIEHSIAGGRLGQYHKNALTDVLDALRARYAIQMVQADTREEAEERVANLAVLHYAYYFAEQQGLGRCLTEDDL
jgi:hypothetical protein